MPKNVVRCVNGYRLIHVPDHRRAMKSANWIGYVYEHILIAEEMLGRKLKPEEVVHHLDGNRANNRYENLLILRRSEHAKLHLWLQAGAPMCESHRLNGVNSGKSRVTKPRYCSCCSRTLQGKQKRFCSKECAAIGRRVCQHPTVRELKKDILEIANWTKIGKRYGVTDNAVRKWARAYGLLPIILSQANSTLLEGAETTGGISRVPMLRVPLITGKAPHTLLLS